MKRDRHLLRVLRYVEANSLRTGLVERAQDWPWSSLAPGCLSPLLHPSPVDLPDNWLDLVNQPMPPNDLRALRASVRRSRPYGGVSRTQQIVQHLNLVDPARPVPPEKVTRLRNWGCGKSLA